MYLAAAAQEQCHGTGPPAEAWTPQGTILVPLLNWCLGQCPACPPQVILVIENNSKYLLQLSQVQILTRVPIDHI